MRSPVVENVGTVNAKMFIYLGRTAWNPAVRPSFVHTCSLMSTLRLSHAPVNRLLSTHLSIDDETAQYIYAHATMASIVSRYNIKDIKDALEDARQRNPSKTFEGRVSEALVSLGLW